ncbi:sugar transferase [uncultured Ilyobacter sp.]|uniref:sugar transferase n=1 Tax=uncultured Ilyobacter sp. TaxID=544433 RepID=UPI0029C047EE|nr:sugar transferase [uncultured Ilyobacter sp.]
MENCNLNCKRQITKVVMIALQFVFYYLLSRIFRIENSVVFNGFLVYLILNFTKNMYSFKTTLIWEELKKQLRVHTEYILIMVINDMAFLDVHYVYAHIIMGILFMVFNLGMIKIIRRVFYENLKKNLIIVGTGRKAKRLTEIISENRFTMYNLIGYVTVGDLDVGCEQNLVEKENIICDYRELEKVIDGVKIDEIIVALPKASNDEMHQIMEKIEGKVSKIKFVPELNGVFTFNSKIEDYDGVLLISAANGIMSSWQRFLKRSMDIAGGLVGVSILGVLHLIYGRKVKQDGGPVLFAHSRIGVGLQPFKMQKFRSMYVDAEERLEKMLAEDEKLREEFYTNFKLKNDPRITPVGEFLRKTSLDEFPQFLNVLKGDMSMVGPRPVVQKEVDMYYGSKTGQKVFMVKPGITGMWQANGRSDIEDYDERIALDMYYMRNWSVWLDIVIIIKTIKSVLRKEGAY